VAKITFNTGYQQEHVTEQVKAAVAAYRAMLDAFVNNTTQRTASEQVDSGQAMSPSSASAAAHRANRSEEW
jgi:hypothetical protein